MRVIKPVVKARDVLCTGLRHRLCGGIRVVTAEIGPTLGRIGARQVERKPQMRKKRRGVFGEMLQP